MAQYTKWRHDIKANNTRHDTQHDQTFSKSTLITTLGIMTLGITTLGIMTLGITSLGITTLGITTLCITIKNAKLNINDTQIQVSLC